MAERGRPRSFDRAEALRRAMELFWAKGFAATSMSDLTTAMGIASPSIYAAYGSKEQLYREALAAYGASAGAEIADAVIAATTARGAVEAFLLTTAHVFSRPDRPAGCMVVLTAINAAGVSDETCAGLRQARAQSRDLLDNRLRGAIASGELPGGIDVAAITAFYVTVQQGMSIQSRDGASLEQLTAIAHSAMTAWETLTR